MASSGNGRVVLETQIRECEFAPLLLAVRSKWGDARLGEVCVKCLQELIDMLTS